MSFIQLFANSTFSFTGGGDFEIEAGDIKVTRGSKNVLIKCLEDLLKSSYKDYETRPLLGINFDKYIGKGLDESLKKEIENQLSNVIISSEILTKEDFSVYSIIDKHTLFIRIILFSDDNYNINLKFDTTTGLSVG